MVELVLWDFGKVSELEVELNKANVEYQVRLDTGNYGLKVPYLIVDGVPLDNKHALKWVRGLNHGN